MSAQTESLLISDDSTEQPPVIIKSGGGGGGPNSIKVEIDGNGNVFDSPRQPQGWQFSRSSGLMSIKSLEIEDGPITLPTVNVMSSEPAVLQISFNQQTSQQTLVINDIPLQDPQITEIAITSPVRCNITKPGSGPDQWKSSEAEFPDVAPYILLTQGGRTLADYQCKFVQVTLTLHVK